jgi:hypothetical protein
MILQIKGGIVVKVVLTLDDEKERVLTSLNLYKRMSKGSLSGSAIQREMTNYEVRLANQLLTQVMEVRNLRTMLSTTFRHSHNRNENVLQGGLI